MGRENGRQSVGKARGLGTLLIRFVDKSFNAEDAEVIAGDAEVILRSSAGTSAPSAFKL